MKDNNWEDFCHLYNDFFNLNLDPNKPNSECLRLKNSGTEINVLWAVMIDEGLIN